MKITPYLQTSQIMAQTKHRKIYIQNRCRLKVSPNVQVFVCLCIATNHHLIWLRGTLFRVPLMLVFREKPNKLYSFQAVLISIFLTL